MCSARWRRSTARTEEQPAGLFRTTADPLKFKSRGSLSIRGSWCFCPGLLCSTHPEIVGEASCGDGPLFGVYSVYLEME